MKFLEFIKLAVNIPNYVYDNELFKQCNELNVFERCKFNILSLNYKLEL